MSHATPFMLECLSALQGLNGSGSFRGVGHGGLVDGKKSKVGVGHKIRRFATQGRGFRHNIGCGCESCCASLIYGALYRIVGESAKVNAAKGGGAIKQQETVQKQCRVCMFV